MAARAYYLGYYNSEDEDSTRSFSPYPSTDVTSSDEEEGASSSGGGPHTPPSGQITSAPAAFQHSLDAASHATLRDVVLRVAADNTCFQRALQKELLKLDYSRHQTPSANGLVRRVGAPNPSLYQTPPASPTTPLISSHTLLGRPLNRTASCQYAPRSGRTLRRSRRRQRERSPPRPSLSGNDRVQHQQRPSTLFSDTLCERQHAVFYHPGHLQDEAYEFVSRTPEGAAYRVVRTITMWSCCDEDESSSGCVPLPSYPPLPSEARERPVDIGFGGSRPVSLTLNIPDDEASTNHREFASFSMSKLSELDTFHHVAGLRDVYPDSDLEIMEDV